MPLNQPTPCMDPILWNFPTKSWFLEVVQYWEGMLHSTNKNMCVHTGSLQNGPSKCEEKKLNRNMILILEKTLENVFGDLAEKPHYG